MNLRELGTYILERRSAVPIAIARSLALLLSGLSAVLFMARAEGNDTRPVPRFEPAALPAEIAPKTGKVEFGYLVVRENRRDPDDTDTIRLPVMIAKSRSSTPRPDPVVFTVGGPGVISTLYGGRDLDRWPYLDDRDWIYFEQRGAQHAVPSLAGPEVDAVYAAAVGRELNGWPAKETLLKSIRELRDRLVAEGIDLTAYNSIESAADLADLRTALGIEEWNLYGISYSCRLMLEVLRRHPEGVRAVILDSPLPPDASWDETSVPHYWQTMQKLFALARNDPAASQAYPDLESRFLGFMKQAAAEPLEVKVEHPTTKESVTVRLDHEGFFRALASELGSSANLSSFPRTVDRLCKKDSVVLARLAKSAVAMPPYSWGMRYSFLRNEELPFEDSKRISFHGDLPEPLDGLAWPMEPLELMEIWPGRKPEAVENEAVASDLPVLVTSGQFDPDTPPSWGRQVAASLSNAFFIQFPGQSHLPLFQHPCGRSIGQAFLANPHERPSEDCIRRIKPFSFDR